MSTSHIYSKLIKRKTGESYLIQPTYQSISLKLEMFKFTSIFDLTLEFVRKEKIKISSHDFIEFYVDVGGSPFQIGVGYLEDLFSSTSEQTHRNQSNGKDLLGQLLDVPFRTTLYKPEMTLPAFLNLALAGEYLETYNKIKSRSGMIIDKQYNRASFLASSDQSQKKGQIIENYGKLACNLIYQDRLGRVVLLGKDYTLPSISGRLIKANNRSNVRDMSVRSNFSQVLSECTVFYTQAQALQDAEIGAINSRLYKNTDPRVAGIINRTHAETFNVADIAHFAGGISAEQRMDEVARSIVRQSNRAINQVIVSTDAPYLFDRETKVFTPFEIGQAWELESDDGELTSPESPDGVDVVTMILTGIDYKSTVSGMDVQLQFSEPNTLV